LIPLRVICHSHFACTMQLPQAFPKPAFLLLLPFLHSPAAQRPLRSPLVLCAVADRQPRHHHDNFLCFFASVTADTTRAGNSAFRLSIRPCSLHRDMTSKQSRQLKVGDRVCFNGEQADSGTVTAIEHRFVIIKWQDGHKSYTGHGDMNRVELVRK